MPLTWKLRLYSAAGALLAEMDTWTDFTLTRTVNAPDTYGLQLRGDDPRCALFELDGILEPWWCWPERGIPWQRETSLWTIGTKRWTDANRARHFISSGKGLEDLLGRVIIDGYSGSAETDQIGIGEFVIKTYVDQQIGPGAGARARSGVTIEGLIGLGVAWTGDRTNKPLLGVVQEIAETSGLQFGLIRTAAYAFEFRVWAPTDRTATVKFTVPMGNMIEPMVTSRADQVKNWIKVGGAGVGAARSYRYVTDPASIALSPQNQREEFVQATDQTTDAKLDEKGAAQLALNARFDEFSFKPAQMAGCTYGLHYFLGDLATAIYDGVTYIVRVNSVKFQVNQNGSDVSVEMINATPATPPSYYVMFNGSSSLIDCGTDASLDKLYLASFTVDLWVNPSLLPGFGMEIIARLLHPYSPAGWHLNIPDDTGELEGRIISDLFTSAVTDTNEALTPNAWSHVVMAFDQPSGKIYISINGVWCTYWTQTALITPTDDTGANLVIGNYDMTEYYPMYGFHGSISWVRISSGLRYTPGVGFVPPAICAPPAVDGTTLELWALDEGTGAVAIASVDAGNTGAMQYCDWYDCLTYALVEDGNPPHYVTFDGDSSYINCGNKNYYLNLPAASFTIDFWVRVHDFLLGPCIFSRIGASLHGWRFSFDSAGLVQAYTTNTVPAFFLCRSNEAVALNTWTHVAGYWNSATKLWSFAIDGDWCTLLDSNALTGTYHGDSNYYMTMGARDAASLPDYALDGDLSWLRISTGDRFGVGVNFAAPARCVAPAEDATTKEIWRLDEGTGTIAHPTMYSLNNGTMTDCVWEDCI